MKKLHFPTLGNYLHPESQQRQQHQCQETSDIQLGRRACLPQETRLLPQQSRPRTRS